MSLFLFKFGRVPELAPAPRPSATVPETA
jgi:hypothetical protein